MVPVILLALSAISAGTAEAAQLSETGLPPSAQGVSSIAWMESGTLVLADTAGTLHYLTPAGGSFDTLLARESGLGAGPLSLTASGAHLWAASTGGRARVYTGEGAYVHALDLLC